MKEITNVTIISTNLNRNIINNYNDYEVIDNNFKIEELVNKKKIIFFNILSNLDEKKLKKLFKYLYDNNVLFINITNNIEEILYTERLIVYNENNIIIDGETMEVLKNEKLLKRLGFNMPFIIELSNLLNNYNLVNKIYLDKESLVKDVWK